MYRFFSKQFPAALLIFFIALSSSAQDNNILLKEAKNLELKFDEPGALEKYKQVATSDPSNIFALVKCTELNCSIGERQKDKKQKASYFQTAADYANNVYQKNRSNADACYAMALVAAKLTEVEDDNKKLIAEIKDMKIYADKALAIDPNQAKANYILGKWHFELIRLSWLKKSGVKSFYEGIPDTQIDSAAIYLEKSRSIDPYFSLAYLDLAKAYQYDHQPGKAIDVLNKLVKLPNRTYDDAAIKEEGKQLLGQME